MSNNKSDHKLDFFDRCNDLLCVLDLEGNFIEVNLAWKSILGYEPSDLIGKNYTDYIHPEDLIDSAKQYDDFITLEDEQQNYRNRYRCTDGTYKWLEWNGDQMSGRFISTPEREQIPENIKEQLIVELYSK